MKSTGLDGVANIVLAEGVQCDGEQCIVHRTVRWCGMHIKVRWCTVY